MIVVGGILLPRMHKNFGSLRNRGPPLGGVEDFFALKKFSKNFYRSYRLYIASSIHALSNSLTIFRKFTGIDKNKIVV